MCDVCVLGGLLTRARCKFFSVSDERVISGESARFAIKCVLSICYVVWESRMPAEFNCCGGQG